MMFKVFFETCRRLFISSFLESINLHMETFVGTSLFWIDELSSVVSVCSSISSHVYKYHVFQGRVNDSVEVSLLDSELNIPGLYLFHDFVTAEEEEVFVSCICFIKLYILFRIYVYLTLVSLGAPCSS